VTPRLVPFFVFALASSAASAQPASTQARSEPPIRATSSVDRSAMWVGDRVTYSVDIECAPGVDVLPDDVAKEKLRLNGLEVLSTDATAATDAAGRTTHHLRYVLTTYKVDAPSPSIDAFSVRYYQLRPGQRPQDVPPAGDVQVPGATLAFRSTLPDNQAIYPLRDGRRPAARPVVFAKARQIGLAFVIVALAPALVILVALVRRRTRHSGEHARRRPRFDHRAALERLQTLDVATEAERRRAYDEISAAVREHVAAHSHVPAMALTAAELEEALASDGRVPRESVTALLATCDRARYGPPEAIPSAEACREALSTAEQVLGHR
jgi:hypothetical protein